MQASPSPLEMCPQQKNELPTAQMEKNSPENASNVCFRRNYRHMVLPPRIYPRKQFRFRHECRQKQCPETPDVAWHERPDLFVAPTLRVPRLAMWMASLVCLPFLSPINGMVSSSRFVYKRYKPASQRHSTSFCLFRISPSVGKDVLASVMLAPNLTFNDH